MVQLVLSLSLFFKFYYWFCRLDCHFLSIDAGCDECHAWGRQRLLNLEHLVVLSAGPIPHNSIHLLIITAEFVGLYRFYWICPFHYHFISCRCWVYRAVFAQLQSFILFFWGHNEYKIGFSIFIIITIINIMVYLTCKYGICSRFQPLNKYPYRTERWKQTIVQGSNCFSWIDILEYKQTTNFHGHFYH